MDAKLSAVDVSTLQSRVYGSLRLALLSGRFVPGEQVSLRGLADMLGTSAMPVREAVQRLVAEGALVLLSNRVIRVALATDEAYAEVIRIRMHIEGYAAERAATRGTRQLLANLRRMNETMRKSANKLDIDAALAANHAFHFALYEAAASPQLLEIISGLWLRSGPMIAIARENAKGARAMFATGVEAHQRIIGAVAERDPGAVRCAIGVDIRAASIWLKRHYEQTARIPPKGRAMSKSLTRDGRIE
jgi:DNA-binding GntR family transcriptional regulator